MVSDEWDSINRMYADMSSYFYTRNLTRLINIDNLALYVTCYNKLAVTT